MVTLYIIDVLLALVLGIVALVAFCSRVYVLGFCCLGIAMVALWVLLMGVS